MYIYLGGKFGNYAPDAVNNSTKIDYAKRNYRINSSSPSAAYMRRWIGTALVQVMACRLFGAKPLPEPVLIYCQKFVNRSNNEESYGINQV